MGEVQHQARHGNRKLRWLRRSPSAARSRGPKCKAGREYLAYSLNQPSRTCIDGQVPCKVFEDAKLGLKAYTLRGRKEIFDSINELVPTVNRVWAVQCQRQADTVRRLVVET